MILLLYLNQFYKTEQGLGSSPKRNSCCIVSSRLSVLLPVPKFKIVLETSLARNAGAVLGDVKQVCRMLTLACEWQIVIIQHGKT